MVVFNDKSRNIPKGVWIGRDSRNRKLHIEEGFEMVTHNFQTSHIKCMEVRTEFFLIYSIKGTIRSFFACPHLYSEPIVAQGTKFDQCMQCMPCLPPWRSAK